MEPPWVKFPEIPAGSTGWRMDGGEDYLDEFTRWFSALPTAEQATYVRMHPPPQAWRTCSIFREPSWPSPNILHRILAVNAGKSMLLLLVVAIVATTAWVAF
jgi:hypothetical protein